MPTIVDPEFGEITIRSHPSSTRITLKMGPDGRLRASVPRLTPMFAVKAMIRSSRSEIRELMSDHQTQHAYLNSQPIGKSHSLLVQHTAGNTSIDTAGTSIVVRLHTSDAVVNREVQMAIRSHVIKALRKEAKSYLPRRLKFLADSYNFSYASVKLTHASSRWGSCSSSGTISLNIALMNLPFELLDYVLIHELAHTREMNHSAQFWEIVENIDPDFKSHRADLKKHTPHI